MANKDAPPLTLGFVRGTAPQKWARRWAEGADRPPLTLVPILGLPPVDSFTVVLERTDPGERPRGSEVDGPRHAVRLYEEAVALVVPPEHPLSGAATVTREQLNDEYLLGYDGYPPSWPTPAATLPGDVLDLVAAGVGSVLLPLPLARHLARKREHVVVPVEDGLDPSAIWATWARTDDGPVVQELIGVFRGRTARSSRSAPKRGRR